MNIVASIQARLGSTRLPGKVLLPLGDRQVLDHVLTRASEVSNGHETLVAVGDESENQMISEWSQRNGYQHVIGPEENILERHLKAARITSADILVRLNADCPFVPPVEIDRVIEAHLSNDAGYTTNFTGRVPHGINVDVVDVSVLEKLIDYNEDHPVLPLRENPTRWNVEYTDDPAWTAFGNIDMTLDTPDDYWDLHDAVEAVGSDAMEIAKWLNSK